MNETIQFIQDVLLLLNGNGVIEVRPSQRRTVQFNRSLIEADQVAARIRTGEKSLKIRSRRYKTQPLRLLPERHPQGQGFELPANSDTTVVFPVNQKQHVRIQHGRRGGLDMFFVREIAR